MPATHSQFEHFIREYLSIRVSWRQVHEVALQLEVENNADFDDNPVLEELQMIFLADENDDPQFRADDDEIRDLLARLAPNS
jgi:hypothetical protein